VSALLCSCTIRDHLFLTHSVLYRPVTPTSQSGSALDHESDEKKVTRGDLIAAIEAGDWAMVGSTAALLASSEHSVASHKQGSVITDATDFSVDGSLVSEFSRLVDSNDWQAVMQVASMLDGASDSESTALEHWSESELQRKADLQRIIMDLVQDVMGPDELGEL
jgi:hypothetical protein